MISPTQRSLIAGLTLVIGIGAWFGGIYHQDVSGEPLPTNLVSGQTIRLPNSCDSEKAETKTSVARALEEVPSSLRTALAQAQALPAGLARADAVCRLASQLARHDPEEALACVRATPYGAERTSVLLAIVSALAADDPILAILFAAALPSGSSQVFAISAVAGDYARRRPEEAVQWVQSLPEGDVKRTALDAIANTLVVSNPRAAAGLAITLFTVYGDKRVLGSIVKRWASSDPEGVFGWANNLPRTVARDYVLHVFSQQMAEELP